MSRWKEVDSKSAMLSLLGDMESHINVLVLLIDESTQLSGDDRGVMVNDRVKD